MDEANPTSGSGPITPGHALVAGARVLQAVASDSAFLSAFISDPKAAYKARFGEELLPGEPIEVRKTADGATVLYLSNHNQGLLIPQNFELTDDMLEAVAGGTGKTANLPSGVTTTAPSSSTTSSTPGKTPNLPAGVTTTAPSSPTTSSAPGKGSSSIP